MTFVQRTHGRHEADAVAALAPAAHDLAQLGK